MSTRRLLLSACIASAIATYFIMNANDTMPVGSSSQSSDNASTQSIDKITVQPNDGSPSVQQKGDTFIINKDGIAYKHYLITQDKTPLLSGIILK